jgi:hypothetical protein
MRDSLGCAMVKSVLQLPVVILFSATLAAQDHDPAGRVRVENQPRYVAPDGSVSEIRKGEARSQLGEWALIPGTRAFALTFVIDDAVECVGPHSVEHSIQGDTLVVTLFDYSPVICAEAVTPREYRLTLSHLKQHSYWLRVYFEGRGGRGGRASGAAPWLSVRVFGL